MAKNIGVVMVLEMKPNLPLTIIYIELQIMGALDAALLALNGF